MTAFVITEIIISIVLLIFILWLVFFKKNKNSKLLITMLILYIILIMHLGISTSSKHAEYQQTIAQAVHDTVPPIITLKGEKEIAIPVGHFYQEPGYSAVDNHDGSIVNRVKIQKQIVDEYTYKLIYSVRDTSGNDAVEERIIHLEKGAGIIYLTFDDGPSNSTTPKILDILKQENVQATFFLLNYTKEEEELVKREVKEGHSVGIHGYSHDYKKIYKSVDAYMENLNKLQNKIYQSTGIKTTLTRFPGGSSNLISSYNPGIMTKLSKEVVARGYQYYDWNVTSGDSGDIHTAEGIYRNVKKQLVKNGSNIILMHDFENNEKTIQALSKIIQYGKKKGYSFKAITPETPMLKHRISN